MFLYQQKHQNNLVTPMVLAVAHPKKHFLPSVSYTRVDRQVLDSSATAIPNKP
jgi:hypothetical protein